MREKGRAESAGPGESAEFVDFLTVKKPTLSKRPSHPQLIISTALKFLY